MIEGAPYAYWIAFHVLVLFAGGRSLCTSGEESPAFGESCVGVDGISGNARGIVRGVDPVQPGSSTGTRICLRLPDRDVAERRQSFCLPVALPQLLAETGRPAPRIVMGHCRCDSDARDLYRRGCVASGSLSLGSVRVRSHPVDCGHPPDEAFPRGFRSIKPRCVAPLDSLDQVASGGAWR